MLEPGTLIQQRYQIVRLIGRGGMGAVYEALDRRLRNTVALKQMLGEATENAEAFEREAQILAALRHPALPKVIDYFRDGNGRFLVMEFFGGADLAALQARHGGPFPPNDVLTWALQLLDALDYLHTRHPPVLHRDIKPQNIKLTPEGQVVLLDFGLAKGYDTGSPASFFGYTLQYAPLEQIEGSGTEPRSDIYALCATLFHLLTDHPPPSAPNRADALLMGRADPLRPPHELRPEVPPALSTTIVLGMALQRTARLASASLMRATLIAPPAVAASAQNDATVIATPSLLPLAAASSRAPVERPISVGWEQVCSAARAQAEPVVRELSGTPRRLGPYLADLYVPRSDAEAELAAFLTGSAGALLLLGDAGTGKTCLLARWAARLRDSGDAVLFYRCGGSLGPEIDRELARDLGREAPDLLVHDLSQIARLAEAARRRLVIIFDALNEYRGGAHAGPADLLRQLDALAGRVSGPWLRIVASCSTAAWGQLERAGATRLFWSVYHQADDGTPYLTLGPFSARDLAEAYPRYRTFFQLQTGFERLPPALRERLRVPLMLRLVAESYRNGPLVLAGQGLSLGLFRRFYDERVRQRREHLFIEELAAEFLRRGQMSAPLRELARNPLLRDELLSDESDSTYMRLLDAGILTELSGDLFSGELVGFAYNELGAYVLARHLLRAPGGNRGLPAVISDLRAQARSFAPAFEIARTILLITRRPETLAELAASADVELRELVARCLVDLHADEPEVALELIKELCQRQRDEVRRTALKAAYYLGAPARDVFLWAARRSEPALRHVVRDTLYMIWRTNPNFTYGLLRDLVDSVGPTALRDLRNVLELFFELSVVIYINHPERADVRDTTVELYYELARQRLHLDLINTGVFGKTIEDLIFQAVASAFSQPILDTMLMAEVVPVEQFFAVPMSERAILMRVAPLFDPATPLAPYQGALESMLRSDNLFFNLVASTQVAIHAAADLAQTAPILQNLFERLPAEGRIWLLISFAVLLPNTPAAWTPLVEQLTERMFAEHPALVYGETPSILQRISDLLLLPLGLAYGKLGQTMPLIELMLQDGLLRNDQRLVDRVVAGLGAVGFYYPDPVLSLLERVINVEEQALPTSLVTTLATIRTLHLDAVDAFMARHNLSADLQRHIAATTDTELVRRYIYWLGLYNQVVHSCLYYPKMRRQMAMAAMEMLVRAKGSQEFIGVYTANVFRMLREAGFRLSAWTQA
ncbi:MAG: serine/threonine-protein kinase [Candidatus Viridilinea halotolerans]|uniref:Serine/threonine-protein kinase n=1 Tax=Candidatus Viridilinea halotolerans TaxID=2491704 RepID=A0A426U0C8_9CHLR|nr:MAG: serine/threonine-protein kinase [Candidatus Viridilinea halotolerans]